MIRTYLAPIFDAKSMKFIQPIRDRLAVPAKRKLERVVNPFFLLFFLFRTFLLIDRRWRWLGLLQ